MQLSMHDVHISNEFGSMDRENIDGNIRRLNPFRAKDRVAFPSFDEALALPNKQWNHVTSCHSNTSCNSSPGWMNLTIGMQALIHPDSFSEDQVSVCSEDSRTSHPWADLSSPDRTNDSTAYHIEAVGANHTFVHNDGMRANVVNSGAPDRNYISCDGRKLLEGECIALNASTDSFDEPPCMADMFVAFRDASRRPSPPTNGVSQSVITKHFSFEHQFSYYFGAFIVSW